MAMIQYLGKGTAFGQRRLGREFLMPKPVTGNGFKGFSAEDAALNMVQGLNIRFGKAVVHVIEGGECTDYGTLACRHAIVSLGGQTKTNTEPSQGLGG